MFIPALALVVDDAAERVAVEHGPVLLAVGQVATAHTKCAPVRLGVDLSRRGGGGTYMPPPQYNIQAPDRAPLWTYDVNNTTPWHTFRYFEPFAGPNVRVEV